MESDRIYFKFLPIIINNKEDNINFVKIINTYKDENGNSYYFKLKDLFDKRKKLFENLYSFMISKDKNKDKNNLKSIINDYINETKIYCENIFKIDIIDIFSLYILVYALVVYMNAIILSFFSIMCLNFELFVKNNKEYYKICEEFNKFSVHIQNQLCDYSVKYPLNTIILKSFSKNILEDYFKLNGSILSLI